MSDVRLFWIDAKEMRNTIWWRDLKSERYEWYGPMVPVIEIPLTAWGDYSGDSVTRANCETIEALGYRTVRFVEYAGEKVCALLTLPGPVQHALRQEDNPTGDDALALLQWYLDETYQMPLSAAHEERADILTIINGLETYPLINDDAHWELEDRLARESWESFAWDYVRREASPDYDWMGECIEEALDDADLWEAYNWIRSDEFSPCGDEWGLVETAVDAYFRTDDIGRAIREHFEEYGVLPWQDRPERYVDPNQPVLFGEAVA